MEEPQRRDVKGESSWDRCIKNLVDEVQFIVCDEEEDRVLATRGDGKWRLPGWFSDNAFYRNMRCMRLAAEDIFGSEYHFTVLRCVWRETKKFKENNTHYKLERSAVVLECQDSIKEVPERFEWVPIPEAVIWHSEQSARCAIKEQLELINRGVEPELRVPWARPGWYKRTVMWMREELKARGHDLIGDVVQERASPWGTVLRARTESDEFFLKATPSFNDEGTINSILSSVVPLHVQKPFVVDEEKRVFISSNHGDSVEIWKLSESEERQLLLDLAKVQKGSLKKLDALRQAGLQTLDAGWIAEHFDSLLEHEELSFMSGDAVLEKLKNEKARVVEALRELERASEGMPMTLVHGDLWENVYRLKGESGRFGFFDWDCAFIGHPLFDVVDFKSDSDAMEAYLEAWSEYQPISRLRETRRILRSLENIFVAFREVPELSLMERHTRDDSRSHIRLVLQVAAHFFRSQEGT